MSNADGSLAMFHYLPIHRGLLFSQAFNRLNKQERHPEKRDAVREQPTRYQAYGGAPVGSLLVYGMT
jgi:hypothetical protein